MRGPWDKVDDLKVARSEVINDSELQLYKMARYRSLALRSWQLSFTLIPQTQPTIYLPKRCRGSPFPTLSSSSCPFSSPRYQRYHSRPFLFIQAPPSSLAAKTATRMPQATSTASASAQAPTSKSSACFSPASGPPNGPASE